MGTSKEKDYTVAESKANDHVDSGYSWVVLGANTVAFCIATGFLLTTGIVHTTLEQRFHAGAAKTSLAGSAFDAIFFLTSPIGSVLIDKGSCRIALVTGSLIMAIGFVITAFSNSIELCIVFCGVFAGLGGGILHPVLFVVLGFNFKRRYSIAQGTAVASGGLGLFAMAPLLETVNEHYGFFGFFLVMAAISLQMLACGMFLRPSKLEIEAKRQRSISSQKSVRAFNQNLRDYTKLLFNKVVLCMSLSLLAMNGAMYSIYILWPTFCQEKGFTTMQASFILSTAGIASVFGRFFLGILSSFQRIQEVTLYSASYALLSIPFLCFYFYSFAYIGHIIAAILVGLLSGAAFVLISSINTKYVGFEFASAAIGIEFFFGGIGALSLPSLSGLLVSRGWTPEHVFLLSGIFLLLTSILCIIIRCIANESDVQTRELHIPGVESNGQNDRLLIQKGASTSIKVDTESR